MISKSSFFGWKVVWAAFVIAVFGAGAGFYGPSVFLPALHATRGWPVSVISAAITAHFLLSAVIVIYLPEIHRRISLATMTKVGVASCGLGIVAWATAQESWQLFPAALLTGAGWATTSSAAINAMIARWFDRERPKALSLALNGGIGGVIFPPLWVVLISQVGFATAALVVALTMSAVIWPLASRFLRPLPADYGLSADGESHVGAPPQAAVATLTRFDLLRDGKFLTISAAFALGLFAQIGLLAHLIARLLPEFGARGAAASVSLCTVCAIIGRTILGWYLGEENRRFAAAINFLVQAIGVLLLAIGSGVFELVLGCIFFGLAGGNHLTLPPLIAQEEFERGDVATVVALVVAINQGVMAFGPVAFGMLYDATSDYLLPFSMAAVAQVVAALILLAGRSGRRVVAPG